MSDSNMNMVNGTPPCQNIMFPNPYPFFPPSSHPSLQHPYHYQPLIHVPTRTNAATIGEVGASVDMMRAQLTELSKRMDAMESNFSEFKNSVSNDMFLLKNTLSEHSTELLNVRDVAENAYGHASKMNDLVIQQNCCIGEMADATSRTIHLCRKHLQVQKKVAFKSNVINVQLGIIRRRVSKIEEFTNDFYEQFESFKGVKDIITDLSDHINECDRDISSFIVKKNEEINKNYYDDSNSIVDTNLLNIYFSNYDDDDNVNNYSTNKTNDENGLVGKEEMYEDDDFEKL
jgi:archaellum component FlaC